MSSGPLQVLDRLLHDSVKMDLCIICANGQASYLFTKLNGMKVYCHSVIQPREQVTWHPEDQVTLCVCECVGWCEWGLESITSLTMSMDKFVVRFNFMWQFTSFFLFFCISFNVQVTEAVSLLPLLLKQTYQEQYAVYQSRPMWMFQRHSAVFLFFFVEVCQYQSKPYAYIFR